jgi:hypothetical protein
MTEVGCTAQPHYILIKISFFVILLLYLLFLTYINGGVFATRSAGPLPPQVKNGTKPYLKSKDWMLYQVANRPNHFLPFRDHAPTRKCAIDTVYDGLEDGLTPEDLEYSLSSRNFLWF